MATDILESPCGPCLIMQIEPETKYRFRYESEGASHGRITGKEKQGGKKTYPTVKLVNYYGPSKNIFIRVTLCTEDKTEHVLEFKKKKSTEIRNYIDEDLKNDYTAEFKNLTILSKKKEEIYKALLDREIRNLGRINPTQKKNFENENSDEIKQKAKEILNSAILRFDAFEKNKIPVQICPPLYSEPICNQKASSKGDLKIHRMSKIYGSWQGEEEVILLCDKVKKEIIKILFYENDDTESPWEEYATFTPSDVHYQVAITFKTPKYKENVQKTVAVCLERNGERSEARSFTYIPEDCPLSKKRKIIPEETLNVLTPMLSSPGSSSADDTSQDRIQQTGNWNDNFKTSENGSWNDNPSISDPEPPSSCLSPEDMNYIFDSIPLLTYDFQLDDIGDLCDSDVEFGDVVHNQALSLNNVYYEKIDNKVVQSVNLCGLLTDTYMDIGVKKAEAQMATLSFDVPDSYKNKTKKTLCRNEVTDSQMEIVKKCLPLIPKTDNDGNTLLHLAVLQKKNIGIILGLCKKAKADIINAQNCRKQTALHIAVQESHHDIIELLSCGANPNIKNAEGNNCFHLAASSCSNFNCMEDLLKFSHFPAQLNDFNYEGLTPLHLALKTSPVCFNILRKNSKIDLRLKDQKNGKSFLHFAVTYQPSLVSSLLQDDGIDVNAQDYEGNTALHDACAAGSKAYNTVEKLVLAGANPSIKNFNRSSVDLDEERSDEENNSGQIPADLTSNPKILQLLKRTAEQFKSSDDESDDNNGSDEMLTKLCSLLDLDMRWKQVAVYVIEEAYLNILKCSSSPTRALLDYMKKKVGDGYLEQFKSVLEMVNFSDALQVFENVKP